MTAFLIDRAWKRLDPMRVLAVLGVILTCAFLAFFLTARPAEADRNDTRSYKYFTSRRVDEGDSLWSIAEEMLGDPVTGAAYDYDTRAYISEVAGLNHITNEYRLEAGNSLVVPYYSEEFK